MRMIRKAISLLLTLILAISGITVSAAEISETSALPLLLYDGATTVVTFTDGTERVCEGVVDVSRLETWDRVSSVASYTVFAGEKELLSVTLNDIVPENNAVAAVGSSAQNSVHKLNGFYAIDFTFPDSEREVFLTGLTPSNLEQTQNAILDSFIYGKELTLENFSFIDTEKTAVTHEDDYLCWAATTSNMLQYSGWLDAAGIGDSDDMFDIFIDAFYDGGASPYVGCSWFLNGFYPEE